MAITEVEERSDLDFNPIELEALLLKTKVPRLAKIWQVT